MTMKTHLMIVICSLGSMFLVFFYIQDSKNIRMSMQHFLRTTPPTSKGMYREIFYEEEEQPRPLLIREALPAEELLKTPTKARAVQTGMKTNSSELYDKTHVNGKRRPPQPRITKPERKNLLILSVGRGGSSLLGSLFDNNPHIMYWFEPLYTVTRQIPPKWQPAKYKETTINVIDSFFQCDFDKIDNTILSTLSRSKFRQKSKALSRGQLPQFSSDHLRNACNNYDHTVIKILSQRVPNTILSLKKLFQEQNRYDAKLVHLVRDPRAVVKSRVKLGWMKKSFQSPEFRKSVQSVFDPILQNIRLGLFSAPSWLKDRFKVVRYEDLVKNMVNVTRELYKFAGLGWSPSVDNWIRTLANNTNHQHAYSVFRNPSIAMNSWRDAPIPLIQAVEDVCGEFMDLFGYEKITT